MGIWIKSQDGGLGEYNKILPPAVVYKEIPDPEGSPFNVTTDEILHVNVLGFYLANRLDVLGTYPTESEAIQVLDDIVSFIFGYENAKFQGKDEYGCINPIFVMPPAGFSKEGE